MSITTKILSNSLIGLVSVLPALLIMPAMATDVSSASDLTSALQAGSAITVTGDITGISGVTTISGKTNSIDLGGHTISGATEGTSGYSFSGGSLALTGGGTISDFNRPDPTPDSVHGDESGALNIGTGFTLNIGNGSDNDNWIFSGNNAGLGALNNTNGIVDANVNNMVFSGNTSNSQGAGLRHQATTAAAASTSKTSITANEIEFSNNEITNSSIVGGSAAVFNSGGTVELLGATNTFTNNHMNANVASGRTYKVSGGAIGNQSHQEGDSGPAINSTMVIGKTDGSSENTFSGNSSSTNGGAIMNRAVDTDGNATLTINGTTLFDQNNAALNGGAIYNAQWDGRTATINLNNGEYTFIKNTAGQIGGAVYNEGTMSIADAVFGSTTNAELGNSARVGGAAYNTGNGTLTFTGTTSFGNNTALRGGAVVNDSGTGSVIFDGAAEFVANSVAGIGTGNEAQGGYGGAIHNWGTMTFNDTATFTNNTASAEDYHHGQAGAIHNDGGVMTFEKLATFSGNKAQHKGNVIVNEAEGTMVFKGGLTSTNNSSLESIDRTSGIANYGDIYAYGGDITVTGNTANGGSGFVNGGDTATPYATLLLGAYKDQYGVKHLSAVDNILFRNNTATDWTAGGLYAQTGDVELYATNITFDNNDSNGGGYGGAVAAQGSTLQIIGNNNTFTNNDANGTTEDNGKKVKFGGGAIQNRGNTYSVDPDADLTSTVIVGKDDLSSTNLFRDNTSAANGGAIHIRAEAASDKAVTTIRGTTLFDSNETAWNGGAISNSPVSGNSTLSLLGNTTFTDNIAGGLGGALYNTGAAIISGAATFSGNKANGVDNDIYNAGTLTLTASSGKTISLAGGIDGSAGTLTIDGAGLVETSTIKNQTATLSNGELHLVNGAADGSNLLGSTITVADGATINTIDNLINDYTGLITLNDGARVKGELNFIEGTADRYSGDSGTIYYQVAKLLGNIGSGTKTIQIAEAGSTIDVAGASALFNTDTGMTLASSGNADGKLSVTGIAGGITSAVEATENYNNVQYDMTANDAITTAQTVHQDMVMNGAGTESTDPKLALNEDLTVGDGLTDKPTAEINEMNIDIASDKKLSVEQGATVALNESNVTGEGSIYNKLGATTKVKNSTIDVDVNTAGTWESDPTIYSGTVNNTGIASFDEDTFTSTGVLNNTGSAFLMRGVTFDNGATITGNGTTTLTAGLTHFDDTTGTSNENTISLARGATFDGKLANALTGVLDTRNGGIDTGLGTVTGGKVYVDADYVANKIDSFAGATTIDKINLINSEYGTEETADLDLGGASLASGAKFSGGYYTAMTDNGDGTVTFSDKLLNTSGFYSKLGSWVDGNNIKQSSSMDHAADGTTYMSVGQALTALDTAIGNRNYVTSGYTGSLLSNGQSVAASILAIANQTDVNTTDIAGKQAQLMNNAGTPAAISSTVLTSINMTPASASDTALVTEKAISTALSTKLDTATALTTYAALVNDNTFVGSQSIVNNKDSVGVGTTAFTVSAMDTDAANGGANASAATFTVNSQGVSVFGGFTTDTLATTGDATVGGNLTTTGNATVHGNATIDGTLTAGQTTIAKSADDGGAGDVTAVSITATDTDAANGGANAKTTTFVVKASGATINGNAVLTSASKLDVSNIDDGAITEVKLATAVQTKLTHAEDAYAAAVTNKTDNVESGNANLVTSKGVYTNAKNAAYNTVATSNIGANSTIGVAISNLDDAIGTTTTGNYVQATNSVGVNLGALDTAVKANADKIGDVDYSDEGPVAGSFLSIGGGAGTTTVRGALDVLDTAVSTHETTLGDMTALTGAHVTSGASVASNLDQLSLAIDAATTGAVAQAATYTDQRIESIDKNLSAGVAGAVALSSVAVSGVERGEVSVGAGYGYFNGQSAAAFGAAMGLSNRWSVNAGAGISNSDVSFRAGTNYKFKLF